MPNRSPEVNRFMEELDHPLKGGIERLRAAILASNDRITEHIKWKAPSFCCAGEDRVTFRLYPEDRAQLVFHRGAKVKCDAAARVSRSRTTPGCCGESPTTGRWWGCGTRRPGSGTWWRS
jgi:hypothetical protein